VQAVGGLMSITGEAAGEPLKVGVALVDVLTGKDAAIGMAAIRHRHRTGAGQYIQVNLMSSLLGALVNQAAGFLATGSSPGRMGNQHPSIAPYETLRCEDGLIAVAAGNDRQFRALAAVLGLATLADDPRFATNPARVENREALRSELEFALSTRPARAWEERLRAVGVACGRVNDIGSAIEYAAQLGLDPVVDVGPGRMPQLRNPVTLTSASPVTPHHQPHWASTPTKSSPGWPPIRTNRCLHSAALWPSP
jgi:crotonobetainyl-CoA:carnitine CoA-transferase CaiB-like acyl-CoA transferase